jgi:hypothetical protein
MTDKTSDNISLLTYRVERMHEDFASMKTVLKELTTAITLLSVVEQRQLHMGDSLRRSFEVQEKLESRVSKLEVLQPSNQRVAGWVDRAMWAAAASSVLFIATKTGLLK